MTSASSALAAYCRGVRERPNRPDLWQVLRGLLLLVFTMVGTAGAAHGDDDALRDMDVLGYVLAFCASAPFITATMLPVPSLAVSAVAVSAYLGIGYSFGPVLIGLGLVTIVAAAATPWDRQVRVIVPIGAVLTTGLAIRFGRDPGESAWVGLLAAAPWLGAPWAIGALIRMRSEGRVRTRREEAARAADAERLRIAAEVHDVAGHGLAVIAMQAGVALHVLDRKPEQARIALEEIRAASTEALDGLRATLESLRTPGADAPLTPGLPGIDDIPALVERIRRSGVSVDLRTTGQAVGVSSDLGHAAYRIVQESLTNVLRHANATAITVRTAWEPGQLTLSVRDDGAARRHPVRNGGRRDQRDAAARGVRGRHRDGRPGRRRGIRRGRHPPPCGATAVIRVAIADDQALVRMGLRVLLDDADDIELVAEAEDGTEALAMIRRTKPDVALLDIRMPGKDGLAVLAEVSADPALAGTRVVMLTTFSLDEYVFTALQSGASGFLVKDSDPAELLQAIRVVADGGSLLSPAVTRRVIEEFGVRRTGAGVPHPHLHLLTEREKEIAGWVATGASNDEIADALVLSPATVRTHVGRAMVKLGARDRAQLVVFAMQSGLTT